MSKRLLTPKEAAAKLATTEKTLSGWRSRGVGPKFVKSGVGARRSSVRYLEDVLDAFIDGLTDGQRAE